MRLKQIIKRETISQNHEVALAAIAACAHYYYESNQAFTDDFLEDATQKIAKKFISQETKLKNEKFILFYDGFGLDTRGLSLIYLKALTNIKNRKIVYVVDKSAKNKQKEILKSINKENIIIEYTCLSKKYVDQISYIKHIFDLYKPANAFLYTYPYDVSAMVAFEICSQVTRFLVNLTDHAYWIGLHAFDYCLEFRNFGYSVSKTYRGIEKSKLIILPFYPFIDYEKEFEGFPFELGNNSLLFSGGALYKTISADNTYYRIVDTILKRHLDVIFLYAGLGDSSGLDELIMRHPNRVYHISERLDLYQVMKRCSLYLNTYPLLGGLMTQYAVAAGKLPITLKNGQVQDGFLIGERDIKVFYDTEEELVEDVDKLLLDKNYRSHRENAILNTDCLISQNSFQTELEIIIRDHTSTYRIEELTINIRELRDEYSKRFEKNSIQNIIATQRNKVLFVYFPFHFFKKSIRIFSRYMLALSTRRRKCK